MWSEETYKGVKTWRWGKEIKITSPAKHGMKDCLVAFNGVIWDDFSIQPTQTAMLVGLGFMARAQQDCFGIDELFIGDWASRVVEAPSVAALRDIAEQNHKAWERRRAGRW